MAMRKQKGWIVVLVITLMLSLCACKWDRGSSDGSATGIIGGSDGPTSVLVGENSQDTTGGNASTEAVVGTEGESSGAGEGNIAGIEGETAGTGEATEPGTDIEPEEVYDESIPLQNNTYTPSEEVMKLLGRAAFLEDTLWMVHSASGAEFQFVGTKAVITLQGDSSAYSGSSNAARVGIFVNGEFVTDVMMDKKEKTVTVWESEKLKNCIVTVVKLSESPHSTVGIKSIEVESEAGIVPTAQKEYYIEFIGDSITCGYGADDEVKEHHFSTSTENAAKTYAYKTAQALDADYSFVSFSGYGIVSGYSGDGQKYGEQVLSKYYEKLGFSYGNYLGQTPYDTEWDFEKRQPDLIVINLGTNDESYTGTDQARRDEYIIGYVAFLKQVRAKNPDAMIFCTLGIMGDGLYSSLQTAVEQYQRETGDEMVHTMRFAVQSMSDGIAADWHPSEKTHAKAAQKLVKEIQSVMGW